MLFSLEFWDMLGRKYFYDNAPGNILGARVLLVLLGLNYCRPFCIFVARRNVNPITIMRGRSPKKQDMDTS